MQYDFYSEKLIHLILISEKWIFRTNKQFVSFILLLYLFWIFNSVFALLCCIKSKIKCIKFRHRMTTSSFFLLFHFTQTLSLVILVPVYLNILPSRFSSLQGWGWQDGTNGYFSNLFWVLFKWKFDKNWNCQSQRKWYWRNNHKWYWQ